MAIKKKEEEKKSRIWQILTTEHKWENYMFVVVSLITLVIGILILTGVLAVKENFWVIGSHPKVFAWIIVVVAGLGLLYALYPFFKPAWPELKKVQWPKGMKFVGDIIRVFTFMIVLTGLFILFDSFITQILDKINLL